MPRRKRLGLCILAFVVWPTAFAQAQDNPPATIAAPSTEKFRLYVDFLGAGYQDAAQAPLGHESQGRIAWAIFGLTGTLTPHISYLVEVNPADDSATPEPACGEAGYFYPNVPDPRGPSVACVPDGRDRVDLYRFVGLDPLTQQGAIRRAVVDFHTTSRSLGAQVGRFVIPMGFGWQEAGSWTNQDATLTQRLNADAGFGAGAYGAWRRNGRELARAELAAFRGDARRWVEYSYSLFVDEALDTNSDLTAAGRLTIRPHDSIDVRVSGRYGFSGSKVPYYPLFTLSKRKDHAWVVSAQYRPRPWLRAFGEYAHYWTGLPDSSAILIGLAPSDVSKPGGYFGGEVTRPVTRGWSAGVVFTHEQLSRNDSLVWYLAAQGLHRATLGERVTTSTIRVFARRGHHVDIGYYFSRLDNPFPWLSGIVPVAGADAYAAAPFGGRKWGIVFRLRAP